jgi:hypothetical protein
MPEDVQQAQTISSNRMNLQQPMSKIAVLD